MRNDMDQLIARLAAREPERSLDGFEAAVLRGVAQRHEADRTDRLLGPVRVVSVALALAMGVTAGGIAAATTFAEPRQFGSFSSAAYLAPSTLLEGDR